MERLGIHSSRQKGSSKPSANDKKTTPNHQGSGPPAPGRPTLPSKALLLTSVLLIRLPPTRPQRIRLVQTRVRMTPVPKALREPFGTGLRPESRRGKDYGCCLGSSCSGFMGKIVRLILLLRVSREASVILPTIPSSPQL